MKLRPALSQAQYDPFVEHYNVLLGSQNYVTRRQSLKLLGELLLDRSNFTTMMRSVRARLLERPTRSDFSPTSERDARGCSSSSSSGTSRAARTSRS